MIVLPSPDGTICAGLTTNVVEKSSVSSVGSRAEAGADPAMHTATAAEAIAATTSERPPTRRSIRAAWPEPLNRPAATGISRTARPRHLRPEGVAQVVEAVRVVELRRL
jgi:hypothetical protein